LGLDWRNYFRFDSWRYVWLGILMIDEPMTLEQIAKIEGISHQRVDQILKSAIRKIVKRLKEQGIKLEDLI
jgi:DNA-directed RNA polymerase sigma subunit (sigma70/sigma32)